ncbi:hypothetical protein Gasu2_25050 [Galdieria sulphuraria]|uniref:Uncharacterized protein n=1 Tax=Galdieria sulphuraria TaxID=130081 RepID=M2X3A3_GALSU|nr:uncharacterized protein Gasu_18740 [Galdieria sulphuraria]EME30860.1 hypothetical protein Gasu_18740 [Galdieria sulphuraria]GJD08200.1 hypothetical protein Gasu2_25050 [Galdieria sulphuraria]|eukprot:XP_005707380.1 hypothetical protein Gasu_18740 [Galdieria sulphuraria]
MQQEDLVTLQQLNTFTCHLNESFQQIEERLKVLELKATRLEETTDRWDKWLRSIGKLRMKQRQENTKLGTKKLPTN